VKINLKLYGSSKLLSEKEILAIKLPDNANIKKLRNILNKIISDKRLKNNLNDLSKTAVFFYR
jgi:hypothetical protein